MSYDIYLRHAPRPDCHACGRPFEDHGGPDLPGPTYNLTPIFDFVLTGEEMPNPEVSEGSVVLLGTKTDRPRGLRLLSGRLTRDTIAWLDRALSHLKDPYKLEVFRTLEPKNGWGTLKDATHVVEQLLNAAEDYPDRVWEIH